MYFIILDRREGESDLQYHKRLVEGKLVDKTLADVDYSELSELVYGQEYSSDVARRMMYGSKRTLDLISSDAESKIDGLDILTEIEGKKIELAKAQQKFRDQRTAFNKEIRERSRQEELNEILVDAVKNGDLPRLEYIPVYIEPSENDLLISLNDIHYGLVVNNAWNQYSPEICRDMLRKYLDKIISIAETHGSESCIVYNCGDAISGSIHLSIALKERENVINQVKGVSELIAEFLAELSSHFKTVRYLSVAGNHSRLKSKDDSVYDERADDLIAWYLEARLQNFPNITIDESARVDATMFLTEIRGKNYLGVHGDYLDNSPSKISALQAMAGKPIYGILSGHLHHNSINVTQGVKTFMAGSFLGMDDYCVQKRLFGRPEQLVCVCDNTGVVCAYDIALND